MSSQGEVNPYFARHHSRYYPLSVMAAPRGRVLEPWVTTGTGDGRPRVARARHANREALDGVAVFVNRDRMRSVRFGPRWPADRVWRSSRFAAMRSPIAPSAQMRRAVRAGRGQQSRHKRGRDYIVRAARSARRRCIEGHGVRHAAYLGNAPLFLLKCRIICKTVNKRRTARPPEPVRPITRHSAGFDPHA